MVGVLALGGGEGSPAHAGMAPASTATWCTCWGFPRPRGDGPSRTSRIMSAWEVPPPTRGWPLAQDGQRLADVGSPAHAGMAPVSRGCSLLSTRFPRPRGDGPGFPVHLDHDVMVPPPTRGWPARARVSLRSSRGSPAHAGMAPTRSPPRGRRPRFPRPRGDGPRRPGRGLRPGVGSPAHAGMARWPSWRARGPHRFPRPRGDGPLTSADR